MMGGAPRGSSEEPSGRGDDGAVMAPMVPKEEERAKVIQTGAVVQARKRLNTLQERQSMFG